jgi:hypothetical protein
MLLCRGLWYGDYEFHVEGCAFLAGLRGRDRSVNTERVYAGRVALFLSWCGTEGIDWKHVHNGQMVRFKRWLIAEPVPSRCRENTGPAKYRSEATGDAILGTVCEFFETKRARVLTTLERKMRGEGRVTELEDDLAAARTSLRRT